MIKFSEYVSPGHPDKVADYISSYLLDRYIERDPQTRYAVEVQIKGHLVTLGGEVTSEAKFTQDQIRQYVREAVNRIGYTEEYCSRWPQGKTISGDHLDVNSLLSQQSKDIARGLDGWGDQGIFYGYATPEKEYGMMPKDHSIAKRLCKALFESGLGGIDIKTQVVLKDGDRIKTIIVAIPLLDDLDAKKVRQVRQFVRSKVRGGYNLIVNGTGSYQEHGPIADCGTTGRKLVVDFYGGNSKIGGGSPWTKDGSKADLTLNLLARHLAKIYAMQTHTDIQVALACCIGKQAVDMQISDTAGNIIMEGNADFKPEELIKKFKLDTPIYESMCRWGLFGEFQSDKAWERLPPQKKK